MNLANELKIRFKALVADRSGLYFKDHDMRNLEDAIDNRMKAGRFSAAASYYQFLTTSSEKDDEFRELVNLLTIHHTYFFRNEPHFWALRHKALPEIISRKKVRAQAGEKFQLRIWSAGCSTGDEPYSVAITVCDAIDDLDQWDIQIFATDAAKNALTKAQRAVYRPSSMKFVDEGYKQRYFSKKNDSSAGEEYALCDEIKGMVQFGYFNLMDENFPIDFDIIFCRNVVIYFELGTTINVMNRLHSSLNDDGYLFIGYSESLQFLRDKFKMVSENDAIYYRKQKEKAESLEARPPKPRWEQDELEKVIEEISRQQSLKQSVTFPKQQRIKKELLQEIIAEAQKWIYLKDYNRALSVIDSGILQDQGSIDLRYLKAEVSINQGQIKESEVQLHRCLAIDSMFVPAHYLFGCLFLEKGEPERAKQYLRKAIYLDHDFSLAYFYLAQVYRALGLMDEAIREYRNTLKVLSPRAHADIISYSGGIDVGTLTNVCRSNLERLKLEQS